MAGKDSQLHKDYKEVIMEQKGIPVISHISVPVEMSAEGFVVLDEDDWLDSFEGQYFLEALTQGIDEEGNLVKQINPNKYKPTEERYLFLCKYLPRFDILKCIELFRHMATGHSYESFGGRFGLTMTIKNRWEREIFEWRMAKKLAEIVMREFYEKKGIEIMEGAKPYMNAQAWKMNMTNRFSKEWRDTKEVKNEHLHSGEVTFDLKVVSSAKVIDSEHLLEPPITPHSEG